MRGVFPDGVRGTEEDGKSIQTHRMEATGFVRYCVRDAAISGVLSGEGLTQ